MAVRSNKIGIVFHRIHYDINDIERVHYDVNEGNLVIKLYNNSEKYNISLEEKLARKYITEINNYRFDKVINLNNDSIK